jgi:hypothetical protein
LNDNVRTAEVVLAQERRIATRAAITSARQRLDSIRLIVEGPVS